MAIKHRVLINDHGTFTLFGMNLSLPAMIDLTEEQINYINNTGLYKISELSSYQKAKAKPTLLSEVNGDRFEYSRSMSVNELSFKTPIMATKFKEKAKNSLIVKKNSIYLRDKEAIEKNKENNNKENNNIKPIINNNSKPINNTPIITSDNIIEKPKEEKKIIVDSQQLNNNNHNNDKDNKKKDNK